MRIRTAFDLGALVAARRRELGMSQTALAEQAGTTRLWLLKFENGSAANVSIRRALDVANVLGLVVDVAPDDDDDDDDGNIR